MSDYSPLRDNGNRRFWQRVAERREAEEADRQRWIADVKLRLGLVCAGDLTYLDAITRDYVRWPLSQYTVVSDHRVEIPAGWPPECCCVLLDGQQVSLGGLCPVHSAATA
jgi:hypothetical protein